MSAEVTADVLAQWCNGERPLTSAAHVGKLAKRVADKIRRDNVRECAADVLGEMASADGAITADDGTRQARAVNSRGAKIGAPKRTDVLAVAECSRQDMRAAEDSYLVKETAARVLAEMAADYVPMRAAERDAWQQLKELAADVLIPAHGIGTAATDWHGSEQWETAGKKIGRSRLFVCDNGRPMANRAERASLRAAERLARADVSTCEDSYAAAVSAADVPTCDLLATAVLVASLTAAHDSLTAARRTLAECQLARQLAIRERAAAVTVIWHAETVAAEIPATDTADVLTAAYVPEKLAERVSAKRKAKATAENGRVSPSKLARNGSPSSGRDWLLDTPRRISWSAALPNSTTATRAAVQRAAREWRNTVMANVGRSFDIDAETLAYRADAAERLRASIAETAAPYVPENVSTSAFRTTGREHVGKLAETAADIEREDTAALRDAYGYGNERETYAQWETAAISHAWHVSTRNGRKPWLSTADYVRVQWEEWLGEMA